MSRTFRRNTKAAIRNHIGLPSDIDSWDLRRYGVSDPKQAYQRKLHRYIRDHHSGVYGVPRWYRRLHGSKHHRLLCGQELFRCLSQKEWDDHLPPRYLNNAGYYWW